MVSDIRIYLHTPFSDTWSALAVTAFCVKPATNTDNLCAWKRAASSPNAKILVPAERVTWDVRSTHSPTHGKIFFLDCNCLYIKCSEYGTG